MSRIIGIDFGGSWLRVGTVDHNKMEMVSQVKKHDNPMDWNEFVRILRRYASDEIEGYGIAIAGPIADHATVIKGPNVPWLDERNVRQELEAALPGKKVIISNDMEAAAEGEMAKGVLKGYQWAIFDTISTGWGGCLILNGQRIDGEPGHVNVSFALPYVCGCSNVGCTEALYSGSAMERRILHHLRIQDIIFPSDLKVWDYFYKELETGTNWATSLRDEWAEGVGRAWANVLNRIRPLQVIVYMGSTAEGLIPRAEVRIRATIRRICMFPEHKDVPILQAQEPNRSILGAVIVYQNEGRQEISGDSPVPAG